MPIVPSMNHRISVASVSSFESLPEDEMVQGFLAPGLLPKSRASSYERIPRSGYVNNMHTREDAATTSTHTNALGQSKEASTSTSSLGSASATNSIEGVLLGEPTPSDTISVLSSSASSSAHGTGPSTTSQTSTISAGSQRPSYFLRRAATAPVPAVDVTLLMAHRQRLAKELLDTERSFVASLTLIDQEYYQPLMASLGKIKGMPSSSSSTTAPAPILSRKSISDIFSNFYDILQLSKELLSQLEERLQVSDASFAAAGSSQSQIRQPDMAWNASTDCVGDILATLAPFLKMYSLFVKNFSSALQRIEFEQKTNEAFAKFLKDTDQKRAAKEKVTSITGSVRHTFGYGLGFQAHLLTIVQRIPRYKLLVDDLVKSTPETHPDANRPETCQSHDRAGGFIHQRECQTARDGSYYARPSKESAGAHRATRCSRKGIDQAGYIDEVVSTQHTATRVLPLHRLPHLRKPNLRRDGVGLCSLDDVGTAWRLVRIHTVGRASVAHLSLAFDRSFVANRDRLDTHQHGRSIGSTRSIGVCSRAIYPLSWSYLLSGRPPASIP